MSDANDYKTKAIDVYAKLAVREPDNSEWPSLLVVEHDIGFLLPLADRIVCLDQGRIVADGKPGDLAERADLRHFFGRPAVPA